MEHTQGKWEIVKEKDTLLVVRKVDPRTYIAKIIEGIPKAEQRANACLIVAAPNLLAGLKGLYNDCRNVPMDAQRNEAMQKAFEAITNAEQS